MARLQKRAKHAKQRLGVGRIVPSNYTCAMEYELCFVEQQDMA